MIALDIETSGLYPQTHSILSIGAFCSETGLEYYQENKISPTKKISDRALEVNGFTRDEIFDESKISAYQNVEEFIEWATKLPSTTLMGVNIGSFDVPFLKANYSALKYKGKEWPFGHRFVDLHSIAHLIAGISMNSKQLVDFLKVEPEPEPHNALEGAKQNLRVYNALNHMVHDHGFDSGNYIVVNSGQHFDFGSPLPETVFIEDIAHALSNTARFAGQGNMFYSVAQHSVSVARIVELMGGSEEERIQALLHDSAEAYLADIPSPAKNLLPDFVRLEKHVLNTIGYRFNTDLSNLPEIVKRADTEALFHEAEYLFDEGLTDWIGEKKYDNIPILKDVLTNNEAKQLFLSEFEKYY